MSLFNLIFDLQKLGVKLWVEDGNILIQPFSRLSDEHKAEIKKQKSELTQIFSPCRHCGSKLIINIYRTWFEVYCPTKPIHFLIEEHARNLGETIKAEKELAA